MVAASKDARFAAPLEYHRPERLSSHERQAGDVAIAVLALLAGFVFATWWMSNSAATPGARWTLAGAVLSPYLALASAAWLLSDRRLSRVTLLAATFVTALLSAGVIGLTTPGPMNAAFVVGLAVILQLFLAGFVTMYVRGLQWE